MPDKFPSMTDLGLSVKCQGNFCQVSGAFYVGPDNWFKCARNTWHVGKVAVREEPNWIVKSFNDYRDDLNEYTSCIDASIWDYVEDHITPAFGPNSYDNDRSGPDGTKAKGNTLVRYKDI